MRTLVILLALSGLSCTYGSSDPDVRVLEPVPVSADTGEKPQSKLWYHRDAWWAVLPDSSGTHLWRLDGAAWTRVMALSDRTDAKADCKPVKDTTYVLLFSGSTTELVVVEYVPREDAKGTYQLWRHAGPGNSRIELPESAEVATIALDGDGRLWLASDALDTMEVRYSDAPYRDWSEPITLGSGIAPDDIGAITALPDGSVAVLWSNQARGRFGFRVHRPGSDPDLWSEDEVPAGQSALEVGKGMSDDHLNCAVASDGTLYVAAKTGYDTEGHTKIGLLVRLPSGVWKDFYHVDFHGTRPIVLLSEIHDRLMVFYTDTEGGGNIVYRESTASDIRFGERKVFLPGTSLNNVSSTKQTLLAEVLVIASTSSQVEGGLMPLR